MLLLHTLTTCCVGSAASVPFYNIQARTLYDAVRQHGVLAKQQIKAWIALEEFQNTLRFVRTEGADAFAAFKRDNSEAFPELVEKMRGIAHGAGVDMDNIWIANLTPEHESLILTNAHVHVPKNGDCTRIIPPTSGGVVTWGSM